MSSVMFNTNDDDEFPATANTNLATLFGNTLVGNIQTDLRYTAPRQPKLVDAIIESKLAETKSTETQKITVVCAKVVIASRLINNSYTTIGKLGFAILGTSEAVTELLLYRDKQNIIAKAPVGPSLNLREDEGNLKFFDNVGTEWIAHFSNSQDHAELLKELTARNIRTGKPALKSKPAVQNKIETKKEAEESGGDDCHIRADILTRMARMGQSVLPPPKLNEIRDDGVSDIRKQAGDDHFSRDIQDLAPQSVPCQKQQTNSPAGTQSYKPDENNVQVFPYSSLQAYQTQMNNQDLRLFMTENRQQNSEVRMNLSTISSKIDSVLSEIFKLKVSPNTDRLENEFLKSKICDLEQELKAHKDGSLNLEDIKRETVKKESLLNLKQEEINQLNEINQDLQNALSEAKKKLDLQESSLKNEETFRHKIEVLGLQLNDASVKHKETENRVSELEHIRNDLSAENRVLRDLNIKLAEDLTKENKMVYLNADVVKDVMNQMYQNILSEFEDNGNISYKDIKASLAKHMKQASFDIIEMLQKS